MASGKNGGPKMVLCSKQYERILNAYRKPGNGRDDLVCTDAKTSNANEHIVVMAYNHLYEMPVKSNDQWLSFDVLFNLIMKIEAGARSKNEVNLDERVPLLTSETRNQWFKARELLLKGM